MAKAKLGPKDLGQIAGRIADGVLRAYPNNPAQRKVMRAQTK